MILIHKENRRSHDVIFMEPISSYTNQLYYHNNYTTSYSHVIFICELAGDSILETEGVHRIPVTYKGDKLYSINLHNSINDYPMGTS
jgi:hypothetical protein